MIDSNGLVNLRKVRCGARKTVIGDLHAPVIAIQGVESFRNQLELKARSHVETTGESQIGRGIVRAKKRVSSVARRAIIRGVAILIPIAEDTSISRPAATNRHHAG